MARTCRCRWLSFILFQLGVIILYLLKVCRLGALRHMLMESRKKGICLLAVAWLIVPILFVYMLSQNVMDSSSFIYILVSFGMIVMGIVVYAGNYTFLSGFNTMSKEERMEYNGDEISKISGLFFCGIAYVSGAGSLVIVAIYGNLTGVVFHILSFLILLFTWVIYVSVGKRFKA